MEEQDCQVEAAKREHLFGEETFLVAESSSFKVWSSRGRYTIEGSTVGEGDVDNGKEDFRRKGFRPVGVDDLGKCLAFIRRRGSSVREIEAVPNRRGEPCLVEVAVKERQKNLRAGEIIPRKLEFKDPKIDEVLAEESGAAFEVRNYGNGVFFVRSKSGEGPRGQGVVTLIGSFMLKKKMVAQLITIWQGGLMVITRREKRAEK